MKNRYFQTLVLFILALPLFSQTWDQLASAPGIARHHPICFALDGIGYMLCGNPDPSQTSSPYLKDFASYDPETDTWTELADFPGPERGFGVGLNYNGKGYAGFGVDGRDDLLNDLWEFDPETETWTQLPDCPCLGRIHPAFLAAQGKIFVGLGGTGSNAKDWWAYDIESQQWTEEEDFPGVPRHHPYYFTVDDVPYVGFGHGNSDANGIVVLKDFAAFDVASGTWDKKNDFPSHGRVAGTHFAVGGKGYILAGDNEEHRYDEAELWEYEPSTDSWIQLPTFPEDGRWAPGAFAIDDYGYFTSGFARNTREYHNDVWRFKVRTSVDVLDRDVPAFEIYPNPTNELINIEGQLELIDLIEIIDGSGKVVIRSQPQSSIVVGHLPAGVYQLKTSSNDVSRYQAFVIK